MKENKKNESYFDKIYKIMCKEDIENNIYFLNDTVSHILNGQETVKVKEMIAVIKKIFKSPLEAKNKFFALLILNEIMKSGEGYVIDYFDKKIAQRLVIITKHRMKERGKTDLVNIGSTCLNE
jgi:sulfatase maturation enzyme AslB (radical SAM superfamily)